MSAAFTTVGSGATYDPFSLSIINEIVLAYSERRQAILQSAVSNVTAGTDGLSVSAGIISAIQAWMESNCTGFADHTQATAGDFTGITSANDLPPFTLATWRAAAGINASGFKRATAWSPPTAPTFSYGQAQAGDIYQSWILEELQAGLSALKWTITIGTAGEAANSDYGLRTGSGSGANCAAAITDQDTQWSSSSWLFGYAAYIVSAKLSGSGASWSSVGTRFGGQWKVTSWPTFRPSSIDEYGRMVAIGAGNFEDIDSFGITEDTWHRFAANGESSDATRTLTNIGGINNNPVTLSSISCPTTDLVGCQMSGVPSYIFVAKWNFTNSN